MPTCRVCNKYIKFPGWATHVKSEKMRYCDVQCISRERYTEVMWEAVVELFNPKNATETGFEINEKKIPRIRDFFERVD